MAPADRHNVVNACESQRNQQGQRRFGSIRCRTEGIQSKDRNALRHTDLLGALIGGSDRAPYQEIENRQINSFSRDGEATR